MSFVSRERAGSANKDPGKVGKTDRMETNFQLFLLFSRITRRIRTRRERERAMKKHGEKEREGQVNIAVRERKTRPPFSTASRATNPSEEKVFHSAPSN